MPTPKAYEGREQSYIKHLFLTYYLERVSYNIFSYRDQFFYIDGFSGPWKSANERNEDTSVYWAAVMLNRVVGNFKKQGKIKVVEMICVEKDPIRFKNLEKLVNDINSKFKFINIEAFPGSFEQNVHKIASRVGSNFSLTFIDPTGWKGLSIRKLSPIFELRGEVIINFMTEHIRRFIGKQTLPVNIEIDLGWELSETLRNNLSSLSGEASGSNLTAESGEGFPSARRRESLRHAQRDQLRRFPG